jgi:hypothetical protein
MLARVVRAIEPARRARVQSGSQRISLGTSGSWRAIDETVFGRFDGSGINPQRRHQLNKRVSLRHHLSSLSLFYCPLHSRARLGTRSTESPRSREQSYWFS